MHVSSWRRRAFVAGSVAVVMAAAMWSAGIPTERWFPWLTDAPGRVSGAQPAPASQHPIAAAPSDASKQPRLHLVSTTPGRNAFEGTAAIGADVTSPQTFSAGALLANGAMLKEIYTDHVVLERSGKRTELFLEGMALNARSTPVSGGDDLAALDAAPQFAKPVREAPATFAEILRGAPHYDDKQLLGFDVYPGTNSAQFAQLGLRAGDLLLAVDGVPMDSQEALSVALRDIAEGRSMVASVRREGQTMQLSLDGSALRQQTIADLALAPH